MPSAEPCSPSSCSDGTSVSVNAGSVQAQPPSPQRAAGHSNPSTPRTPRSTRTFSSSDADQLPCDGSVNGSASPGALSEADALRQQLATALVRVAAAERQRDTWAAKYREAALKASALSQRYEGLARYIAIALHQRHQQHRSRLAASRTPRLRAIHESSSAEAAALASSSSAPMLTAPAPPPAAALRPLSIRFARSRPQTPPRLSPKAQSGPAAAAPQATTSDSEAATGQPPAAETDSSGGSGGSGGSSAALPYRSAAQMPALLPPLDVHPCEEDELEESLLEELQRCADRVGPSSPTHRLAAKPATRPYGLSLMQASSLGTPTSSSTLDASGSSSMASGSGLGAIPQQWHDASEPEAFSASAAEAGGSVAESSEGPGLSRAGSSAGSPRRAPRMVASAVSPFAGADAAAPLEMASGAQAFTNGSSASRQASWHMNAAADAAAAIERAASGVHGATNGSASSSGSGSRARAATPAEEDCDGEDAHWSMQQPTPPTAAEVERARRRIARRWSEAIADAVCSLEPWAGALEGLQLAGSLKQELRQAWEEQQARQQQQGQQEGQGHRQQDGNLTVPLTWWDVGKDMAMWAQAKARQSSAVDVAKTVAVTGLAVWAISYAWGPGRRRKRSSLLY